MTASSKHPHQRSSKGARKRPKHCAYSTTAPRRSHRIAATARHNQQCLSPDLGPYEYTAIDEEASEIRLMTLLPGVFGSEVRITIQNHVFSEIHIPKYEALSYAWGSNEKSAKLRIKGSDGDRTLAVTSNLAEALQYLRYEDRRRVLWIDAICVDQQNFPERGHQVSRMADIYRSASPVLIWLGPESASSDVAMRELSALGSTVRVDWGTLEIIPLSGASYPVWQSTPYPFSGHGAVLRSIELLLDRLWFKRLWIWQEVRLAKSGTQILCGDRTMLWKTFRNAMMCFGHKSEDWGNNLLSLINHISCLCNYSHLPSSLFDILDITNNCTYSDPRDRIYAILNLIYPPEISGFETDYLQSTEEVFRTFAMNYIATNVNLDLLSECEMRGFKELDIPSWVPDWTKSRECNRLGFANACRGSKGEANFDVMGILKVTVCCVGTVDSVHNIVDRTISTIVQRLWRAIGQEKNMGVADDSKMDALCRTLCGHKFSESCLPPSQNDPHWQESQAYILNILKDNGDRVYRPYLHSTSYYTRNRAFFTTKEGDIGLAPCRSKPGDILCIVLGCQSPLVFRANKLGNHTVVGECYLDGYMDGEGLLGRLPSNWQCVDRYDPVSKGYLDAFLNRDTGIVQVEDPRLGPLPPGWRIANHMDKRLYNKYTNRAAGIFHSRFDPRMSSEALKARGIDLQEYRLV